MATSDVLLVTANLVVPDQVLLEILENNEGIEDKTVVEWQHWDWVDKIGSKFKQLDNETKKTTKKKLVEQCIADLHSMAFHLFSCNWNYSMFLLCKDNLRPGELLQVLDFGQKLHECVPGQATGGPLGSQPDSNSPHSQLLFR